MADEITLSVALAFSDSGDSIDTSDMGLLGLELDVTGRYFVKAQQSIGTTAELLGKGEIGTVGYLVLKNLDATNYIELDNASFTIDAGPVRVKPGGVFIGQLRGTTIYACAKTASCIVKYLLIED